MPDPSVPASCDVIVIGAGPAGSACAQRLAEASLDVLLVDQHPFPRDKICGDGLIPDAHVALRQLGVLQEVMDQAAHASHVRCVAPRGGIVDVPGTLACALASSCISQQQARSLSVSPTGRKAPCSRGQKSFRSPLCANTQ